MSSVQEIGSGKYGTVYKICVNSSCKQKIARKNSENNLGFEFRIMKLLHSIAPTGIVKPLKHKKTPNKNTMYLEFVNLNMIQNIAP